MSEVWDLTTEDGRRAAEAAGLPIPRKTPSPSPAQREAGPRKATAAKYGLDGPILDDHEHLEHGNTGRVPRNRQASAKTSGKLTVFEAACLAHGLPLPIAEYAFAYDIGRRWRFDWLFEGWLALEIQGGIFTNGRHVRGNALLKEYEKLNAAVVMGYAVLFATPEQVEDGSIFATIKAALGAREEV